MYTPSSDLQVNNFGAERPTWAIGLTVKDWDLAQRGIFVTAAAAAYASLSEAVIRKAIASGELPARRQGKGWRTSKQDLDVFLGIAEA